jgi:uncharacterized protein
MTRMDYLLVCGVALLASALTFFSGFGLGTLLMPAFALFFPVETAVGATAVVHLANNLFKLVLVGGKADRGVLARFALPAVAAAFLGAWVLVLLGRAQPLAAWSLGERVCEVTALKVAIAVIIAAFAAVELTPSFDRWAFPPRLLAVGGVVSGFFGGLSGHQGALRTAFLVRCGLSKEAFIATGVAAACLVDLARLGVYASHREHFTSLGERGAWGLVAAASVAAFAGALIGARLIHKVTMRAVRVTLGVMLVALAAAMGAGVV